MNTFPKLMGWLAFFLGLSIICYTLFASYNIFTGKAEVPAFFETPKAMGTGSAASSNQQMALVQQALSEQLKGLFPADFSTRVMNLAVWSMLAFILISGGSKIAALGIKLLKEEKNEKV
jgi:hypothetical protein